MSQFIFTRWKNAVEKRWKLWALWVEVVKRMAVKAYWGTVRADFFRVSYLVPQQKLNFEMYWLLMKHCSAACEHLRWMLRRTGKFINVWGSPADSYTDWHLCRVPHVRLVPGNRGDISACFPQQQGWIYLLPQIFHSNFLQVDYEIVVEREKKMSGGGVVTK
jgi:hypothetical protein